MPQSRPIIEWYKLIPDPEIREKALAELNISRKNEIVGSYSAAIDYGILSRYYSSNWLCISTQVATTWPIPDEQEEQVTWDDVVKEYHEYLKGNDFTYLELYLQENYEHPKRKS